MSKTVDILWISQVIHADTPTLKLKIYADEPTLYAAIPILYAAAPT